MVWLVSSNVMGSNTTPPYYTPLGSPLINLNSAWPSYPFFILIRGILGGGVWGGPTLAQHLYQNAEYHYRIKDTSSMFRLTAQGCSTVLRARPGFEMPSFCARCGCTLRAHKGVYHSMGFPPAKDAKPHDSECLHTCTLQPEENRSRTPGQASAKQHPTNESTRCANTRQDAATDRS